MSASCDTESNSENKSLIKQDTLQLAIKEITSSLRSASIDLLSSPSSDFDEEYYRDHHLSSNDYECHICTIITCTICSVLSLVTIFFIVSLMIMGGIDIEPINLNDATANINMTIQSKKSYLDFTNPSNTQLSNNFINSFISAVSLNNTDNETRNMFKVNYENIEPLFGSHLNNEYHTKISIFADISSEKIMDKLLSGMMIQHKYKDLYKSNLESLLKLNIDSSISLWYLKHLFKYPIVCTTQLHVNKITRGTIIGGIKYLKNEITHSIIHSWGHEDVRPEQVFFINDIIGISFITESIYTHAYILCEMTKRISDYMNNKLIKHNSGPFKVSIDSNTVRCCVSPNGNIQHNLPSNQCVGHQGDRKCNRYQ